MSSIVTSPAVPPNWSLAINSCSLFSRRMSSALSTDVSTSQDTNSLQRSPIVVSKSSSAAFLRISLLSTSPDISSTLSTYTGILPWIMIGILSMTSLTVSVDFTEVITTLGVMISVTFISLSFRRFCITASSSSSITSDSSAISARTDNSFRVTVSVST